MDDIPRLLAKYKGSEQKLIDSVRAKYGAQPPAPSGNPLPLTVKAAKAARAYLRTLQQPGDCTMSARP